MHFAIWAFIIGALLTMMALAGTLLQRLPLSTAMLYLAAGFGLGPAGLELMTPDPIRYSGGHRKGSRDRSPDFAVCGRAETGPAVLG